MTNSKTYELTDDQIDAIWARAGHAQDLTMVDFCERALDGDETSRRIVERSARDVEIYAAVVRVTPLARGEWR